MELEAHNAIQGTELDGTIFGLNEEVSSVTDRQVKGNFDSRNNVLSASQFQEFIYSIMKEFYDLKARMRSEKITFSKSIKAVTNKMSTKMKIANKNLSDFNKTI
jgi:hypothetical protein